MITFIKKILPYFVTSLIVVGLWWLFTRTENYAWNPKGKEILQLEIALIIIFYYKTFFWLVIANSVVFIILQLFKKNYKTTAVAFSATLIFYIFVGQIVNKKCAFHYYTVFRNQSVSEEYILRPIIEAGYQIGPILTENIATRETDYRRYAIGGLEKIKYKPAATVLTKILFDKSEAGVIRADAFQALVSFNTKETRKTTSTFRKQASDSLDKMVIEYADYWAKHK